MIKEKGLINNDVIDIGWIRFEKDARIEQLNNRITNILKNPNKYPKKRWLKELNENYYKLHLAGVDFSWTTTRPTKTKVTGFSKEKLLETIKNLYKAKEQKHNLNMQFRLDNTIRQFIKEFYQRFNETE